MYCEDSLYSVWQLNGGSVNRPYSDMFLRYGIGLLGPGDAGLWTAARSDADFEGSFVRRFATELQTGDIVLLRTGLSTICAVGRVAGEYRYLPQFDDVNGWDLQHARRIRWCPLPAEHTFSSPVFGANPPRFAQVRNREVIQYARRFVNSPPTQWQQAPLPDLPPEEPPLALLPVALRGIVALAHDLQGMYGDEERLGDCPREDELVAHFVIPFLRALGWAPEQLAVKWRNIDVAVFSTLPRTAENCRFVIEAKRWGAGVEGALAQARGYVDALGIRGDIVVTDGFRYRLYDRASDYAPVAYGNLIRLKKSAQLLFQRMTRP